MSRTVLKFFSFTLFVLISQHALAVKNYVIEHSYFEDKTAQMSFEEAKNQNYQPMGEMLSKGYGQSAFWVRLKIESSPTQNKLLSDKFEDKLILRIQPAYLDEIKLYDPIQIDKANRVVGDQYSLDNSEYVSLNFNFVLPKVDQERYIWLRLKTTSTSFMQAQVFSYEDCAYLDRIQEFGFAFYLAILFLLFVIPLFIWLKTKELLTGVFALKEFGAITLLVFNAGYLRIFLKDIDLEKLQLVVNLNLVAYSLITIVFHYAFLNTYALRPWAKAIFFALMITFPFEVLLILSGRELYALHLNMLVISLMTIIFLIVPAFGIYWRRSSDNVFSRALLIIIHLLIFIVGILTTLPSLGYMQGNAFSSVSGLAYGGITGIIFIFILQYRYRLSREAAIAKISSAEAYANAEKERREQQGKFLSMLTHELKTPLSVLKMSYGSNETSGKFKKHIQSAISDMTDVIDRCVMDDKLQNHEFSLNMQELNLADLLKEKIDQYENVDRIQLQVDPHLKIKTDVQLFKICISNLIDNALKYGDETKPILIKANRGLRIDDVVIEVQNEVGSSGQPDPERVFEKYYREPKAYEKTGSGLGLYLVKNFVELLSGTIQCDVREQSVVFRINFPASLA